MSTTVTEATETDRARVRSGVDLLDLRGPPDWRSRIDPDRLNVDSGRDCVLGQVYGTYWSGLRYLELSDGRGFGMHCEHHEGEPCNAPVLTELWREVLRDG